MAGYVAAYRIGMLASGAGVLVLVPGSIGRLPQTGLDVGYLPPRSPWSCRIGASSRHRAGAARHSEQHATARNRCSGSRDRCSRLTVAVSSPSSSPAAALAVLLFVVLYKFCDAFAGALTAAFRHQYRLRQGDLCRRGEGRRPRRGADRRLCRRRHRRRLSLATALWIGGIVQMLSNLTFAWLALIGTSVPALTVTIIVENFTGAIGTVIFVAYLSALCGSRLHTATQFALLTALAAVGRTTLASGAGFIAEETGWCCSSPSPRLPRCRACSCPCGCRAAGTLHPGKAERLVADD